MEHYGKSMLCAAGAASVGNTDLVLLITADDNGCLPGMIAIASACDVDPSTKRPVLGALNVCPGALEGLRGLNPGSEAEATALGRMVEVLVHEMVHVLGFGSNHYEDWRGPDGKVYGRGNVIQNVRQVARNYFSCPSLPGAPLENEGPSFSSISHFEFRYVADYGAVEVLDWGRGAGCSFVLDSCWGYMSSNPKQQYFCGKGSLNQTRCTPEARGWGVCRGSAFSDGCLLVGKYSSSSQAAVPAAAKPSMDDGRQAACYSPPQLQRLQQGGAQGSLLPLLGGSYGASPRDICYNLIQPRPADNGVVWVNGHGAIPEDSLPGGRQQRQRGGRGEAARPESGSSCLGRIHD
eukprot:gene2162-2480_t